MFKNYLKIAWRNLKKNRLYASVNIIGLTVGIVSCLLIGIYIREELSYDQFNSNADKIVRVTMEYNHGGPSQQMAVTGTKVGPQFKRVFPEVLDYVRFYKRADVIKFDNQFFKEDKLLYADPSIFSIFSYKLNRGNVNTALDAPNKVILTETTSKKYFNNADPIGKTLKIGDDNFMVSGIAADAPTNSQIQFDFILPFNYLSASKKEQWFSANYTTYLLLKDNAAIPGLQKQIFAYMKGISKNELKMTGSQYLTEHLQPLTSVHLSSNLRFGLEPNGSMMYIYIMTIVAVLILVIACVNYVNLSIAQSAGRGAEIGIRKVMGAAKHQLFRQFIGESIFITAIAVVLAFGCSFIFIPLFNQISGKQLQYHVLIDPVIIAGLILLGIIIGFLAGAYPALLLSNVKLAKILKSGFSFTSGQGVRRSLIIFQFVISIFLIVMTTVILRQLSFIRSKDIGYNKSNVIVLPVDYKMLAGLTDFKKVITGIPGVESVASANDEPINVGWGDNIQTADGQTMSVNALPMDEDFVKTMQLKIIAGKGFSNADVLKMDTTNQYKNYQPTYMLNESAVKALGWTPEQAVGKSITRNQTGIVKAVVKDFNFKSFHDPISPLLIFLDHDNIHSLFIRVSGNSTVAVTSSLEKLWKERVPYHPFEYKFLDDDYDALYRTEQHTASVFTTFSGLAILLACLGLFAVTAYAVIQRTKEIGIRKVLGANIANIIVLISKDFLLLVIIATVIASPIAWFIAQKWLQDFAYRINIHWWIFVLAGAVSLAVAGITVSIQALKAALANPVKSLKSE